MSSSSPPSVTLKTERCRPYHGALHRVLFSQDSLSAVAAQLEGQSDHLAENEGRFNENEGQGVRPHLRRERE